MMHKSALTLSLSLSSLSLPLLIFSFSNSYFPSLFKKDISHTLSHTNAPSFLFLLTFPSYRTRYTSLKTFVCPMMMWQHFSLPIFSHNLSQSLSNIFRLTHTPTHNLPPTLSLSLFSIPPSLIHPSLFSHTCYV